MTASILFELNETDPDSDLARTLKDLQAELSWAEQEILTGQLMIYFGQKYIERGAAARAVDEHYAQKKERAAATRAAKASSMLDTTGKDTP